MDWFIRNPEKNELAVNWKAMQWNILSLWQMSKSQNI